MAPFGCQKSFMEVLMAIESHLAELELKHRTLDQQIEKAIASPGVDDAQITRLKAEKLKLKDQMERLSKATRH